MRYRTNAHGIYYFALTPLQNLLKSENEAQGIEQGRLFAGDGTDKVIQAAKGICGYLSKIQAEQKHDAKGLEETEEQEENEQQEVPEELEGQEEQEKREEQKEPEEKEGQKELEGQKGQEEPEGLNELEMPEEL